MKDNEKILYFAGLLLGFSVGVALSVLAGSTYGKREISDRGFAEYNQRTGDWQWKTNLVYIKPE